MIFPFSGYCLKIWQDALDGAIIYQEGYAVNMIFGIICTQIKEKKFTYGNIVSSQAF